MRHEGLTMLRDAAKTDLQAVPRTQAGEHGGTLLTLLAANAATHGKTVAMRERDRGIWREFTWNDMLAQVLTFAAALDSMGFRQGEGLLVIGDNRPRLYFGMLGAAALRGLPAPVYPDVPPDDLEFYASNGRARFALAEDQEQVDKLLELRARTGLPEVIVYDDPRGMLHYKQPGVGEPTDSRSSRTSAPILSRAPSHRTPPCCCTPPAPPANPRASCCSIAA
jgi:long-chain acyl-CoA synthetase